MKALEIIIIIFAVILVLFTVIFNIVRKKKGKGCGCMSQKDNEKGQDKKNCSACPYCDCCAKNKNLNNANPDKT